MTEGLPDTGNNNSRDNSPEATESAQVGAAHEPSRQLNQDASGRAQQHETIEDENTLGDGDENDDSAAEDDEEDEDEDEDEDEEPKLKYARLTQHLGPVYRNGDATSSFLVGGDKMIIGTHNGNIHVIQSPIFQSLRVYHAHSASVTSISISPFPPPLPSLKSDGAARNAPDVAASPHRPGSHASEGQNFSAAASRRPKGPPPLPNTPSNNIYIATSSMDGNICVQSLVDMKDVHLRNFARPVQAVGLSPDYKNDRTYISGGLAGQLVLTVGAPQGRSTATTTGASAQAAGWLGNMVGASTGKDTVLHSGEGTINAIKWSLSGKFVVWLNEHGIKIMRTKLHLDSADSEHAWKRIGHIDRPQGGEWETMASVWKGRVEWIDEQAVESDENPREVDESSGSPAAEKLKLQQARHNKNIERLLVGWGGSVWIIHVHPGSVGTGKNVGERSAGRAEIVKFLRMDCIISGISLYTQNLLLVLAYCLPEEDEEEDEAEKNVGKTTRGHKYTLSTTSAGSEPSGGIIRKQNNQPPEIRLIDLTSQAEVDKDGLSVSRYERLSSGDYHLGILPAQNVAPAVASSRGVLDALSGLGSDMWNAAINPKLIFNSGASIKSGNSGDAASGSKVPSTSGTISSIPRPGRATVHPNLIKPGVKIFVHSPYDCILATKRDLGDHLGWLLERQQYQQAWELVDEHPEIMTATERSLEALSATPDRTTQSDDFYEETSSVMEGIRHYYSSAEKEKRRIGELWVQELIEAGDWTHAGQICGKVVGAPDRWEKWVWTFAGANKFDEIANYIPTEPMRPPIPSTIYEVVLGHYIEHDKLRFKDLLDRWSPNLLDVNTIITTLENQLKYRDVREDAVEDGQVGRDWRIVMESLARLHEVSGRTREALKCHIKLQDADSAMRLIREGHLAEVVADDIPSFIGLRVSQDRIQDMTRAELEEATSEAIALLVDEAQHGLVKPELVITQLQAKDLNLYTYFYLRSLWKGEGIHEHAGEFRARLISDSQSLVDEFADLTVHLFALFDQPLLMDFLKTSTAYTFEKAAEECEHFNYISELVYLYSKTGQMKRALYLIIDRLGDVSLAIAFAKEQDDPDLWDDLLNYSMDKPRFIRGLLEEVGTAINPITLVRRIPEGLAVEGLREGLKHIMKEHEIQYSISLGVARVLRSEVAAAQNLLRSGQQKGIKFEVVTVSEDLPATVEAEAKDDVGGDDETAEGDADAPSELHKARPAKKWQPGRCAQCYEAFTGLETETLVGFACGHVFHLSHLLECLHPGKHFEAETAFEETTHRGVAAKVTHARLLRDRIEGGCPGCIAKHEAD